MAFTLFARRTVVAFILLLAVTLWFFWHPTYYPQVNETTYGALDPITSQSKYAIATFLTGNTGGDDEDSYYVAAGILTYQILHANETRCRTPIPFLVVVTDTVSQEKQKQLAKDGAWVVPVKDLPLSWWIKTGVTRWKDQFTKLRIFEMIEFDRILFVDADTILTRPLDGVFEEDVVVEPTPTLLERRKEIKPDEAPLPVEYVFAARSDNAFSGERDHPFPPVLSESLSAGFWIAAPSREVFAYLLSIMRHYRRFDPHTMEQSLFNYAFRRTGAMPWTELNYQWSATWPNLRDLEGKVATLHEKLWLTGPEQLQDLWKRLKQQMEDFHKQAITS